MSAESDYRCDKCGYEWCAIPPTECPKCNPQPLERMKEETWEPGSFVRVREDHEWLSRRGADAMVRDDFGGGEVAVIFAFDRSNNAQRIETVGVELWNKSEFDLSSLSRTEGKL